MTEELPEEEQPSGGGGRGGIIRLVIVAVVILVAAGGGVATYQLVLRPMLAAPEEEEATPDTGEYIPTAPVMVDLPENYVNVIMEEENVPASTLLYAVTFECNNQMTADLVAAHLQRFSDMVSKLHDSRLRSELDDIKNLKASIQREARQKANEILRQLQGAPRDDIMVTNVFHRTLMVDDKL